MPGHHRRACTGDIGTILLTGRAMGFAARVQGYGSRVNAEIAINYARLAGLTQREMNQLLPVLKAADVINYTVAADGSLRGSRSTSGSRPA